MGVRCGYSCCFFVGGAQQQRKRSTQRSVGGSVPAKAAAPCAEGARPAGGSSCGQSEPALPPSVRARTALWLQGDYVLVLAAKKAKLPSLWIMGAYHSLPR